MNRAVEAATLILSGVRRISRKIGGDAASVSGFTG
jgi:hypothetical protein